MSIEYADNTMRIDCDEGNCQTEIYFGDWHEAWAEAKADGWRAWKDKTDEWCHTCPSCVEAGRLA